MSSRPRPILLEMPVHIKENIVHHVDIEARFQLRNCSKEYRNLVDNTPTVYTNLSFRYCFRLPVGVHDGYEFTVTTGSSQFSRDFREFNRVQSMDLFQKHFSRFLKNPKAKFEKFHIATGYFPHDQLQAVLSSLNRELAVKQLLLKECSFTNANHLLSILPELEPRYLEHMDLGKILDYNGLNQITDLEQFKQAKSAIIRGEVLRISIDELLHFRRLKCYRLSFLSVQNVQTIIDNALRQGEEFERWKLVTLHSDDSIEEHFGTRRTFNVPNSDHRLTFVHDGETFYLTNEARRLETDRDLSSNGSIL